MPKNPISCYINASSQYQDPIGDLAMLRTKAKNNLVEAINEVNDRAGGDKNHDVDAGLPGGVNPDEWGESGPSGTVN